MTSPPPVLITPTRAKEIRREAARHAAGMLLIATSNWDPRQHVRSDAEADLLNEEITAIALDLRARASVGMYQPCAECGIPYRIKTGGTVGRHHGMDAAGFSSGKPCPGVGKPPRTS